jgi:hypothetical protein
MTPLNRNCHLINWYPLAMQRSFEGSEAIQESISPSSNSRLDRITAQQSPRLGQSPFELNLVLERSVRPD